MKGKGKIVAGDGAKLLLKKTLLSGCLKQCRVKPWFFGIEVLPSTQCYLNWMFLTPNKLCLATLYSSATRVPTALAVAGLEGDLGGGLGPPPLPDPLPSSPAGLTGA